MDVGAALVLQNDRSEDGRFFRTPNSDEIRRPIVIDAHDMIGRSRDTRRMLIVARYFVCRGHQVVFVAPHFAYSSVDDPATIDQLAITGLLIQCKCNHKSYDNVRNILERRILKETHERDGCVVSNSQFRRALAEYPNEHYLVQIVHRRLLMPTFVHGEAEVLFAPDGPMGRTGLSFERTIVLSQSDDPVSYSNTTSRSYQLSIRAQLNQLCVMDRALRRFYDPSLMVLRDELKVALGIDPVPEPPMPLKPLAHKPTECVLPLPPHTKHMHMGTAQTSHNPSVAARPIEQASVPPTLDVNNNTEEDKAHAIDNVPCKSAVSCVHTNNNRNAVQSSANAHAICGSVQARCVNAVSNLQHHKPIHLHSNTNTLHLNHNQNRHQRSARNKQTRYRQAPVHGHHTHRHTQDTVAGTAHSNSRHGHGAPAQDVSIAPQPSTNYLPRPLYTYSDEQSNASALEAYAAAMELLSVVNTPQPLTHSQTATDNKPPVKELAVQVQQEAVVSKADCERRVVLNEQSAIVHFLHEQHEQTDLITF